MRDGLGVRVRRVRQRREPLQDLLHRHEQRRVIVDREDRGRLAVLVAKEDRARLQDLAVLGLRKVRKLVVKLARVRAQRLQHHVRGTVSHLAAGNLAVLYRHDGAVRVARLQVVHNHLAVVAKLRGHAARQALQEVNLLLMHGLLHVNVSRSSRRPRRVSLGEKGGGLSC